MQLDCSMWGTLLCEVCGYVLGWEKAKPSSHRCPARAVKRWVSEASYDTSTAMQTRYNKTMYDRGSRRVVEVDGHIEKRFKSMRSWGFLIDTILSKGFSIRDTITASHLWAFRSPIVFARTPARHSMINCPTPASSHRRPNSVVRQHPIPFQTATVQCLLLVRILWYVAWS
jgi:hypothetical protein